jgi:adenine-specific DNA-methyltransferase
MSSVVPASRPEYSELAPDTLVEHAERIRVDATRALDATSKSALGQYFTPAPIAKLIAGMGSVAREELRILDPGAGSGMLSAAYVAKVCSRSIRPKRIVVTAFEIDDRLHSFLRKTALLCERVCRAAGIQYSFELLGDDFIGTAVRSIHDDLFGVKWPAFDVVVMNPPYGKIRSSSIERRLLHEVGIETTNSYTAFVSLALRALESGGELIAITPRSFCNGPYFTPFRKDLLRLTSLTHVHVFDTRDSAFGGDDVLQENLVFRIARGTPQAGDVSVEWSAAGEIEHTDRRTMPFDDVVKPGDPDFFIHIAPDAWDSQVSRIVRGLPASLADLGIDVSTGRVVEFRAKAYLRPQPEPGMVPLIYPAHFNNGAIEWPKADSRKPNAIEYHETLADQFNPAGTYVLVKRFSSKEEARRVVAAVITPASVRSKLVAFENHLNFFHRRGSGLDARLARGLAGYLNSTLVDSYFRQFNGHTQVNATDLRKLPYPSVDQLARIGEHLVRNPSEQSALDEIVEGELINVPGKQTATAASERRIGEAQEILKGLGLPREQTNERAALTLLAMLDLKPTMKWAKASRPLRGVTPIMEFAAEYYGKHWKPNTRETVRRFTLHQFEDAGVVVANPDKPDRPVNSPAYCYQAPEQVLALVTKFGTPRWKAALKTHLAYAPTLSAKYAKEREMQRIPLTLPQGKKITLSPGGQNDLIAKIVTEFCSRFTPGAIPIYVGDADTKWSHFDEKALKALGVSVDSHGKMPDVVVHLPDKNWLVLIEAVTSHGPVNPKRRGELKKLFARSKAPPVFVTAFMTRQILMKYLAEIAWETEVWVADAPSHLIHFNGERFLGPYD